MKIDRPTRAYRRLWVQLFFRYIINMLHGDKKGETKSIAPLDPSALGYREFCGLRTWSPTGIATFQSGSPGSGILDHFLAGTDRRSLGTSNPDLREGLN